MESCLEETVDSVLAQTYRDIEVICIDDGSTDGSLAMLERYAARDDRVIVIAQDNQGPALSRNAGLDRATGDYIMLLDSDDVYGHDMLEKLHDRALDTGADVVICRAAEYDHHSGDVTDAFWTAKIDQIPRKDPFSCADMYDYILTAFIGWPWDKLYRRSLIEDEGLRFPAMKNSEDLYFVFLSLVLAENISFYDEVFIKHRVNRSGSVSSSRAERPTEFYKGICLLKEKLQENPQRYEKLSWGFLNWAFDYTLWNIETLPLSESRTKLIDMLAQGEFTELELSDHGAGFFSLFPDCVDRYTSLLAELDGAAPDNPREHVRHPWLSYVVTFFAEAQGRGFRSALGDMANWVSRRSGGENDSMRLARDRGKLLPFNGQNTAHPISETNKEMNHGR